VENNLSWRDELVNSFKDIKKLYEFLGSELNEKQLEVARKYPLFIPRSLALKIKRQGLNGPLAKQFLPSFLEIDETTNNLGLFDPIGDHRFLKAPQLIHRYSTRALFTPTSVCPINCRYCFRKNELNPLDEIFNRDFDQTIKYLKDHPGISEIIFTGGDPLTLSDDKLENYLTSFSRIKSIKDIRFHTRYPVILPERIDEQFIVLLKKFSKHFRTISIGIHSNHVTEFDEQNISIIKKLSETKIQLLSQTVLLKGVNDDSLELLKLFELFIDLGVRPYYLHHPDRVKGGLHFYLPLSEGRKIYHSLRDHLPGWAIPHYVLDIPEGDGKITAFNPESYNFSGQILKKNGQIQDLSEP
jgi:lysine 2,3-aminomutase